MQSPQIGEYPDNWKEIAQAIKDEAGWRCKRCQHVHEPATGYCLGVHHLDGNKSNCEWWNLPALCQRCHLQIQHKVVMCRVWYLPHSEWFKPYVAGYYASVHGMPTDKEYVLAHIDELIALGQAEILGVSKESEPDSLFRSGEQELEDAWPSLEGFPDGIDMFSQYPVAGEPT